MMRVSTRARYGVRVLVSLVRLGGRERFVSTRHLARREGVSVKYLERILGLLRRAGIVETQEGRGGGVRLCRDVEDISVADVVCAVDGKWSVVDCLKEGCPRQGVCPTQQVWRRLNDVAWTTLVETRLSQLL